MPLKLILQAILLTAEQPLSLAQLQQYFAPEEAIQIMDIQAALLELARDCATQSFELMQSASGYRLQTKANYQVWVQRHQAQKPVKYSRAFLETLALIAWRQPITRADIEAIRGVAVNPTIIKSLLEREWIKVLGQKEVPGRPELLGTTRQFLDYFGLRSLDDLPNVLHLSDLPHANLTV
jgi:segregation and condensation protein B